MTDLLDLYRLKNLIRYNNKTRLKDENVAEHSYFVAMISLDICNTYHLPEDITFKCLVKSLLHDLPEMELNDITHDVKTKLHLDDVMLKYEQKYYKTNYPQYADLMNNYIPIVDEVVKLADIMSVSQYCQNEFRLGNKSSDIMNIQADTEKRRLEASTALTNAINKEAK